MIPENAAAGYVAFALKGSEPNRAWSPPQAAVVVDAIFREFGLASVYLGGAGDVSFGADVASLAHAPVVNLAGQTSLAQALTVLQHATVTIAVDSGPMHLAAAVGSPVVALFGPGNPAEARPWSDNARVVSTGAPCGCVHPRCDYTDGPGRCMRAIDPDMVIATVRTIVSAASSRPP
jgi:ADP-heptose:LPS heptosyltransferase